MNTAKMSKMLVNLRGTKTQTEVANAIGISVSALSMYELGNRIPRDEVKIKIANYYGSTVASIFFDYE